MKCTHCGAPGQGRICEYCGSELHVPDAPKQEAPVQQQPVQQVTNVYIVNDTPREPKTGTVRTAIAQPAAVSPKSKDLTLFLCLFFGFFGAHQFYTGHWKKGLLYLFTLGICGIGWLIDCFVIIGNAFKDGNGLPVKGRASWTLRIFLLICAVIISIYGYSKNQSDLWPTATCLAFFIFLCTIGPIRRIAFLLAAVLSFADYRQSGHSAPAAAAVIFLALFIISLVRKYRK